MTRDEAQTAIDAVEASFTATAKAIGYSDDDVATMRAGGSVSLGFFATDEQRQIGGSLRMLRPLLDRWENVQLQWAMQGYRPNADVAATSDGSVDGGAGGSASTATSPWGWDRWIDLGKTYASSLAAFKGFSVDASLWTQSVGAVAFTAQATAQTVAQSASDVASGVAKWSGPVILVGLVVVGLVAAVALPVVLRR